MSVTQVDIDPEGDTLIILPHDPDAEDSEDEEVNDEAPEAEEPNSEEPGTEKPDPQSHFKVSMKHLILASPRAKKMFEGNYTETQPDTDGLRRWTFAPIFDPEAFEIVMNAIHGYTHKLPRTVTLGRLAKISAIVDDLDCSQSLWFFAKTWIAELNGDMNAVDLSQWILVSFVFDEPETFKVATGHAILEGDTRFNAIGLPIRPKISDTIDAAREQHIERITSELNSLIGKVREHDCHAQCKSLTFGTLTLELMSANLIFPSPPAPYLGLRLFSIHKMLESFKLPRVYHPNESLKQGWKNWKDLLVAQDVSSGSANKKPHNIDDHTCDLRDLVTESLSGLLIIPPGLQLSDFR